MDHAQIVDQLMQHGKQVIDKILHAPDLQGIAAASLAIFERMRALAHALLQAKIDLEAQRLGKGPRALLSWRHEGFCPHPPRAANDPLWPGGRPSAYVSLHGLWHHGAPR